MEVITIIEEMRQICTDYELDYINSNIVTACFDPICFEFKSRRHKFNNWELETQLHKMIAIAEEFMSHSVRDYTSNGHHRELVFSIIGKVYIENLTYNKYSDWKDEDYRESLRKLFEEYERFVSIVKSIRIESDIIR
jgi:hypothetical protein